MVNCSGLGAKRGSCKASRQGSQWSAGDWTGLASQVESQV